MEVERTELEYREGNSDKVYIVALLQYDNGYQVEFQYGRRYNVGNRSVKPNHAVPFGVAKALYEETIHKKRKKGYVDKM